MAANGIQVGDRVVGTQVPDVFTVVERHGAILEIESERGLRMRVLDRTVRKLDGAAPPPKDA